MGAIDAKLGDFTLTINNQAVLDIPFVLENSSWQNSDGVRVSYRVIESAINVIRSSLFSDIEKAMGTGKKSTERQSSGILNTAS